MMQHSPRMQRRSLLKLGAAASAVLGIAGAGVAWWKPGWQAGRLTAEGRTIFAALSRAVLGPLLPPTAHALQRQVDRIDATIAGLAPAVQQELASLLALLAASPTRLALTGLGAGWREATDAELGAMLDTLRHSPLALRRQVYHALRDLVNAAWFADTAAWQAIGYPGPRVLTA